MVKKNFKIIFAGGGTGGHLYSGIAVADLVRETYPQGEILFVGTPFGLETKIVPEAGYALELIKATPLKGSGIKVRLQSLIRLPQAYSRSKRILQEFKPDIVLGIGGYASGPMTLAAHFQKIFTAIIEQNSYPGFTNRTLGRFVDKIFIAFKKAEKFFDAKKTFLTGNPVRKFTPPPISKPERPFTVFILGGSQGAHALNEAVKEALPLLKDKKDQLYFIHQTGSQDFEDVKSWYRSQGVSGDIFPFRSDLEQAYQKAHLALCRAGAGTITELRLQGLPAILVPYPYATDDHQKFNAEELVEQGAAELCLNQDLNGAFVAKRISYFLEHPEELQVMGNQALAQAKPHAAQEVLKHCLAGI